VDFAGNYILVNYGGKDGMNLHEYSVLGYSTDGGKTFLLSPLVQGAAGSSSVDARVGLAAIPKGSTIFFDIHSHPTGMNGKGQMQFSGYDPTGRAKEVYSGDVQFSRVFIDHARGLDSSRTFSGYTTRESHRSYLLCEGYKGMGVLWFSGNTAHVFYP
jgi:hypothetical protein